MSSQGRALAEKGVGIITGVLVVVVVAIAGYLVYSWWRSQSTSMPKVVAFSLEPTDVTVDGESKLSVSMENPDKRSHSVKLLFSANPLVSFFKPNGEALNKDDSRYTYSFTIESVQPTSVLQFIIKAGLAERVNSAGYPISMEISIDGKAVPKSWDDVTLTVRRS